MFLAALALFASSQAAVVALAFLLGLSALSAAPALNARMFNVAGAAPTLAGATTTAAFNLGNTSGPWLGGTVIDADFGFAATAWAGAAMTVLALAAVAVSLRLQRGGGGRSRSRLIAKSAAAGTGSAGAAVGTGSAAGAERAVPGPGATGPVTSADCVASPGA
ncbi:hypothetical protein SMICM17S_12179 [Streptomyces microflavus]